MLNPSDPLLACQVWEALYVLQTGKAPPFSPRLFSFYLPPVQIMVEAPASPSLPPFAILKGGEDLIFLCSGVQNFQQFLDTFVGSLSPSPVKGKGKVNDGVLSKAEEIYAKCRNLLTGESAGVLLCGYSLGGAIAECLWPMLVSDGVDPGDLSLCTWASPRPGDADFRDALQSAGRRWFRRDDPVPYFPPHTDEATSPWVAAPLSWVSGFDRYCHPLPGFSLYPDGSVAERALPLGPRADAAARLLQWSAYVPPASTDHTLAAYLPDVARLVNASPKPLPVRKGSISVVLIEQPAFDLGPPKFDTPDLEALLQRSAEATEVAGYIPPKFRAIAKKYSGSKWSVLWLTRWVIEPDSRSHAKSTAKWLNKLTRILATSQAVRGNSLVQSLTDFMSAATDTANGFRPVWTVNAN